LHLVTICAVDLSQEPGQYGTLGHFLSPYYIDQLLRGKPLPQLSSVLDIL